MRIGVDWGGTKIEAIVLSDDGATLWRQRVPTPRDDYTASVSATVDLIRRAETETGSPGTIGIGIPGVIAQSTGLVKNANSTWLIGKPFKADIESRLGREIRCANDANCLALSEATDGAGAGKRVVFAVILGTGCGGGIAIDGAIHEGPHAVAGEWGHNPLPWQTADEYPGPQCYCGRRGCIETWISGTSFERQYAELTGQRLRAPQIVERVESGDRGAAELLSRYQDRLARALAHVVNLLDPDIIVLGGGMSNVTRLYNVLPQRVDDYVFGHGGKVTVVPAMHGDSSGVRGAAWL
ncbi:MAG TPA: ROK family protein [Candidatus Baltobacteraceae bacterium]|nr:ROK family protein [Candidatus Baltobacteraceae bacterium]